MSLRVTPTTVVSRGDWEADTLRDTRFTGVGLVVLGSTIFPRRLGPSTGPTVRHVRHSRGMASRPFANPIAVQRVVPLRMEGVVPGFGWVSDPRLRRGGVRWVRRGSVASPFNQENSPLARPSATTPACGSVREGVLPGLSGRSSWPNTVAHN